MGNVKCCACRFTGLEYQVGVTRVHLCDIHLSSVKEYHPELLVRAIVEEWM